MSASDTILAYTHGAQAYSKWIVRFQHGLVDNCAHGRFSMRLMDYYFMTDNADPRAECDIAAGGPTQTHATYSNMSSNASIAISAVPVVSSASRTDSMPSRLSVGPEKTYDREWRSTHSRTHAHINLSGPHCCRTTRCVVDANGPHHITHVTASCRGLSVTGGKALSLPQPDALHLTPPEACLW